MKVRDENRTRDVDTITQTPRIGRSLTVDSTTSTRITRPPTITWAVSTPSSEPRFRIETKMRELSAMAAR